MCRESLVPKDDWIKLDKPISLGSVERPNAIIIRHKALVQVQEGKETYKHEFALANMPPGPDVICGIPWIEVHRPDALAALETHGGAATEKPIPMGPCKDHKIAFSAGGDLLPKGEEGRALRILAAVESEEEQRRILVTTWVRNLEEQNKALQAMRCNSFNAWVDKVSQDQDEAYDSGYESREDDETADPVLPPRKKEGRQVDMPITPTLPPIRGLKKNEEGWEETIPRKFRKWLDVFEDVTPDFKPVSIPGYDCDIELKEGACLENQRPYKMTQERERWMKLLMEHRLKHGICEESMADNACPVFWVQDPPSEGRNDGQRQARVVDDLRDLNKKCKTLDWPLPRIDQLINRLAKAKIICSLDVKSAYDTIPLTERSRDLSTFVLPWGKFRWTRMPQGYKNAPAIIQRRYMHIFADLVDREGSGLFYYIDDFYPYADTQKDMDTLLEEIFRRARKYGLRFSPKKTVWSADKISCLGFVIEPGKGVRMQADKVALIHELKPPQNKNDVLVLQGTINFYNTYIPHFADKASCITDLLKKDVPFEWTEKHAEAWKTMCRWVREDVYQQPYDHSKRVVMYTDASDEAIGIIIMQPRNDDPSQLGMVLCAHRKFRGHERGWGIPDKELFAGIHAFRKYHYLLAKCEWRTDHRNLSAFLFNSDIAAHEGRRARWWEEVAGYDFTIVPVSGKEERQQLADFYSRYGYPVSPLKSGNPLELERFSPKALVDIASWFRFEGMGLRERIERMLSAGEKKERRHLERTADKVVSKSDEIDGHLEALKNKVERGLTKITDPYSLLALLSYFSPISPVQEDEIEKLNDSEHAEHASEPVRAAPMFASPALRTQTSDSFAKFLLRHLVSADSSWKTLDKDRAKRWLLSFWEGTSCGRKGSPKGMGSHPRNLKKKKGSQVNWGQDLRFHKSPQE